MLLASPQNILLDDKNGAPMGRHIFLPLLVLEAITAIQQYNVLKLQSIVKQYNLLKCASMYNIREKGELKH